MTIGREATGGRRAADREGAPEDDAGKKKPESGGDGEGPAVGTRLSAAEIHDNVRRAAEEELERPLAALFWSALAAGLTIGFSFVGASYTASLVAVDYRTAAVAAAYPLGFIFVVLARSQLFTENTLEPIIPLLARFSGPMLGRVGRLWAVVLLGNMIGALAFGLVMALTPAVPSYLHPLLDEVARKGTDGGFLLVGYRAVFAGWLIALMAWLVASTRFTGAQIVLVWLTTAPIAAFGFTHSIAGSVEAFYRAARGTATWSGMTIEFIIPAILGNIVGGVLLVALLNHGQVVANRDNQLRRAARAPWPE